MTNDSAVLFKNYMPVLQFCYPSPLRRRLKNKETISGPLWLADAQYWSRDEKTGMTTDELYAMRHWLMSVETEKSTWIT